MNLIKSVAITAAALGLSLSAGAELLDDFNFDHGLANWTFSKVLDVSGNGTNDGTTNTVWSESDTSNG